MQSLLRVPYQENPTSPFLTPGAAHMVQSSPLLALGTLDAEDRPWTTVWGGEPGFSRPVAQSIIGVKSLVDRKHDPVVETLLGGRDDGEVVREEGNGRMVSGLVIDLEKRKRVKLYGRMVAGALGRSGGDDESDESARGEVQLVVKIEQSLGISSEDLLHSDLVDSGGRQLSEVLELETHLSVVTRTKTHFRYPQFSPESHSPPSQIRPFLHLQLQPRIRHGHEPQRGSPWLRPCSQKRLELCSLCLPRVFGQSPLPNPWKSANHASSRPSLSRLRHRRCLIRDRHH